NLFFLALVPTLISNLALIEAIKRVGSTTTAILGSMEPVTAVTVGIFVFAEPFSVSQFMGIVLIIAAVTLVILSKQLKRRIDMLVNATLKKGR
ncbi:MAG: EamA family transporter, partial [Tannerellaceae bacterium]